MSEKSLREMTAEVKERIALGRPNEAVSMAQALLRHVPRYLQGYRLLAEAALEQGNTRDAIEIFRRVLSVDPEDPFAYAGIATAFAEENDLREALWHMLRSFELRPNLREIRQQLRYLYEQHEGRAPGRLPLNAAALARSYLTTGRYSQAIPDLEQLIADEPDRVDLRLALAEAQWRVGRRDLASRYARQVLLELPYALKANLFMGQLFAELGEREAAQAHFDITQALDPENEMAQQLFGEEAALKPTRVLLQTSRAAGDLAAFDAPAAQMPSWLADLTLFTEGDDQEADWDAIVAYERDWRTLLGRATQRELEAFRPDWRTDLAQATRQALRGIASVPAAPVATLDRTAREEGPPTGEPALPEGPLSVAPATAADFWLVEPEGDAAERWDSFATSYRPSRTHPLPPLWRLALHRATREALAAREQERPRKAPRPEAAAAVAEPTVEEVPALAADLTVVEEAWEREPASLPPGEWVARLRQASELAFLEHRITGSPYRESAPWYSDGINPALRRALSEAERLEPPGVSEAEWGGDLPGERLLDEAEPFLPTGEWVAELRIETMEGLAGEEERAPDAEATLDDESWEAALLAEEASFRDAPVALEPEGDLDEPYVPLSELTPAFDTEAEMSWEEALAAEYEFAEGSGEELALLVSDPMDALDSDVGLSPTWRDVLRANTDLALALRADDEGDEPEVFPEERMVVAEEEPQAVAEEEPQAVDEEGQLQAIAEEDQQQAVAEEDQPQAVAEEESQAVAVADEEQPQVVAEEQESDEDQPSTLRESAQAVTDSLWRKTTAAISRLTEGREDEAPEWHAALRSATATELDEPSHRGFLGRLRDAASTVASSAVSRVQEGAEALRDRVSEARADHPSEEGEQPEAAPAVEAVVPVDEAEPEVLDHAEAIAPVDEADEALEQIEAAEEAPPESQSLDAESADGTIEAARRAWQAGATREALGHYQALVMLAELPAERLAGELEAWVARGDAPVLAYQLLGDLYRRQGQMAEALAMYREAIARS